MEMVMSSLGSFKFYVYEMWNPLDGNIFYVGVSSNKTNRNRLKEHIKETNYRLNHNIKLLPKNYIILKILKENRDIDFRIVYTTDDRDDALNKEIELIEYYGKKYLGSGKLANMTNGGDDPPHNNLTDEQRLKLSEKRKGKNNGMYGKNHTEKSKAEIKRNHLERVVNGNHKTAKPIYSIDMDGNIIERFFSFKEANRKIAGNANSSQIRICATSKKHWRAYGYYWRYVEDYDPHENFKQLTINKNKKKNPL
jgi:hypothetical protein